MKLSILVPVYNEIETIDEIIKRVKSVKLSMGKEIIVVDDGSTDGTRDFLSRLSDEQIKVLFHDRNMGKGMAIRSALKNATGSIIIIQDSDLEYDPRDYVKLLEPIIQGKASVVYGNRRTEGMKRSYNRFYWGGRLVTAVTNFLYKAGIHDEPVCYKVFKKDVLDSIILKCEGFEFCPEVTAKVCKAGYEIYEVPISYNPRSFLQGKKLSWRDGFYAIWILLKYKFTD
jgi:glycosyltransferase involved in cell wall biosynthesis